MSGRTPPYSCGIIAKYTSRNTSPLTEVKLYPRVYSLRLPALDRFLLIDLGNEITILGYAVSVPLLSSVAQC